MKKLILFTLLITSVFVFGQDRVIRRAASGGGGGVPETEPTQFVTNAVDQIVIKDGATLTNLAVNGFTATNLLNNATGTEIAFDFDYEVNKATSGNDYGFVLDKTDTFSPGASFLMDLQAGSTTKFNVTDGGDVTAQGEIDGVGGLVASGGHITADTGNITASNGDITADVGDITAASGNIVGNGFIFAGGAGNGVLYTDGALNFVEDTSVSPTELGYLGGVTSDIQTQIDAKLPVQRYENLWIDAGAMVPRTTSGAEIATEEYATNDIMSDYLLFDGATEEGAQFRIAMPENWDRSTVKFKFYWDAASGATASDGVTWGIAAQALSNDDAIDTAFGASVDTDDTVIAVGDLHVSAASSSVTVSGTPALGDVHWFEVTRVVGDTNDDMVEDAKLLGIMIQYQTLTTTVSAW